MGWRMEELNRCIICDREIDIEDITIKNICPICNSSQNYNKEDFY